MVNRGMVPESLLPEKSRLIAEGKDGMVPEKELEYAKKVKRLTEEGRVPERTFLLISMLRREGDREKGRVPMKTLLERMTERREENCQIQSGIFPRREEPEM